MSEKPKFPIGELIKAGPHAPRVLVTYVVQTEGPKVTQRLRRHAFVSGHDRLVEADELVDWLIKSQVMLARSQGAGAGAVAAAAELAGLLAGPAAALSGTIAVILADLTALAWIQIRLSLMIAAAYGHDLSDVDTRSQEILALHGLETAVGNGAGPVVEGAAENILKRLLLRYLRGKPLQALKGMFRLVGIKFSRAALIRGLPVVNVPANALVADLTTRRSADKARAYYRTLPRA